MTTCTSVPCNPTDQKSNGVPHRGLHPEMLLYSAQTPSPHRLGSAQDDDFGGATVPTQGLKEGRISQRYEELWTSTSTWTSVPYPPTPCGNPPHVGADANDSSSTRASHLYDQHPHSWHNAQRLAQGGQPIVSAISPTLSNISPTVASYQNRDVPPRLFWPAAHQPIPPEQRSPYSELAVNLAFLEKLKEEEKARALAALIAPPAPSSDTSSPRSADITVLPPALSNRNARAPPADKKHPAESPVLSSVSFSSRSITIAEPSPITESANAVVSFGSNSGTGATWNVSTGIDTVNGTGALRNVKEPRKPSLACTFCRERKIACGRPPSNSPDPTCNQCARRSFKCEYKERVKSTSSSRKTRK